MSTNSTLKQLQQQLGDCAPPTGVMKLVFALPAALQDVEQLTADPEAKETARIAVKRFGYRWQKAANAFEHAEHLALVEAFVEDAVTRLVADTQRTYALAERLLIVASLHGTSTTGNWARDAARDLRAGQAITAREDDTGDPGPSAA